MTEKEAKAKLREIKSAMRSFPKAVRLEERAHREEMRIQKAFNKAFDDFPRPTDEKVHPWRLCPYGKHAVRSHPLHVPPSRSHPNGVTQRRYHCAYNRNRKDVLYRFEIETIAEDHFSSLRGAPKEDDLGYGKIGNEYDSLIRGWTKYWNEVLKPTDPLDPDLVKALIATESSFDANSGIKPRAKGARGLMQLTQQTTESLRNERGELRDHYVNLSRADVANPCLNIVAGIRWLFRKRETAAAKLHRMATWDEAVADYKRYLNDLNNPQMVKFRNLYQRLKA